MRHVLVPAIAIAMCWSSVKSGVVVHVVYRGGFSVPANDTISQTVGTPTVLATGLEFLNVVVVLANVLTIVVDSAGSVNSLGISGEDDFRASLLVLFSMHFNGFAGIVVVRGPASTALFLLPPPRVVALVAERGSNRHFLPVCRLWIAAPVDFPSIA